MRSLPEGFRWEMTFRRMASTTWGAGTTGKPTWPRRALQREKRGVIWRKRVAWDEVSRIFWGETAGKFTDRRQKGDRNDAEPSNNGITLTHWNVIETSLWHNHKKTCENMPSSPPILLYYWYRCCRRYYRGKISGTYLLHRGWIIVAVIFTILLLFTSRVVCVG